MAKCDICQKHIFSGKIRITPFPDFPLMSARQKPNIHMIRLSSAAFPQPNVSVPDASVPVWFSAPDP